MFDKIEINNAKFDESLVILSQINSKDTIKKLLKTFDIYINPDELDFYYDNIKVKIFQRDLVFLFFSKYFGSINELFSLNKKDYCKLIIILKKFLYDNGFKFMQHILTGDVIETINKKHLNKKMMTKISSSPLYDDFKEKYKDTFTILENGDIFTNYLNTILNSKIALLDYVYSDINGKQLKYSDKMDLISHEFLRYLILI